MALHNFLHREEGVRDDVTDAVMSAWRSDPAVLIPADELRNAPAPGAYDRRAQAVRKHLGEHLLAVRRSDSRDVAAHVLQHYPDELPEGEGAPLAAAAAAPAAAAAAPADLAPGLEEEVHAWDDDGGVPVDDALAAFLY